MSDLLLAAIDARPQYGCGICDTDSTYFDTRQGIGVHMAKTHRMLNRTERERHIKMYNAPQEDASLPVGLHIRMTNSDRRHLDAEAERMGLGNRSDMVRAMMDFWFGTTEHDTWKARYEREHRLRLYAEEQARRNTVVIDSVIQRLENIKRG